jgi:Fe-S-cluster formation regulator IscX/YfhJ
MKWFEFASTETRKIVKNEERLIHFLDFRETFVDINFFHEKDAKCNECALNQICAWIYEKETYYNYVKIVPQKLTKEEFEKIILKIKNEE